MEGRRGDTGGSQPKTENKYLKIMQWNARGILGKIAEFKNCIAKMKKQPDIICIQETFLKEGKRLLIPTYNTERRDRENKSKGGGVAILVKENLPYTVLDKIDSIEEISIAIKLNGQTVNIANVYNPPDININSSKYTLLAERSNTIIVGDLNTYTPLFGGNKLDGNGHIIEQIVEDNNLVVLNNGSGTHIKNNGELSAIDVSIASRNIANKCQWHVYYDSLGSDHHPIVITVNKPPDTSEPCQPRYCYKKADWKNFKQQCKRTLTNQIYDENVSKYSKNITEAIHKAATDSIPQTKSSNKRSKTVPYWNEKCNKAVNDRKKSERKMKRTKNIDDCINYRKHKAIAQKTLRDEQRQYWENYCEGLTTDTKLTSIWRMAKRMSGADSNHNIPTITENGVLYETEIEKAEILAKTFASISSDKNYSDNFRAHKAAMEEQWKAAHNTYTARDDIDSLNQNFELHELINAIKQCKKHSAPGEDNISYELLKQVPKSGLKVILILYNKLWKEGNIIPEWKESIILPFHKPGTDAKLPQSYRPISLTSALCKINERLIAARLSWYLEKKQNIERQPVSLS